MPLNALVNMSVKISALISNSITTSNGQALDVIRCGAVIGGFALIALQTMAIASGQGFDPLAFGTALAALFAGTGAGIMAKSKDEAVG